MGGYLLTVYFSCIVLVVEFCLLILGFLLVMLVIPWIDLRGGGREGGRVRVGGRRVREEG